MQTALCLSAEGKRGLSGSNCEIWGWKGKEKKKPTTRITSFRWAFLGTCMGLACFRQALRLKGRCNPPKIPRFNGGFRCTPAAMREALENLAIQQSCATPDSTFRVQCWSRYEADHIPNAIIKEIYSVGRSCSAYSSTGSKRHPSNARRSHFEVSPPQPQRSASSTAPPRATSGNRWEPRLGILRRVGAMHNRGATLSVSG